MKKKSSHTYRNLCNEEVLQVFRALENNSKGVFFGITGDIDNLGEYVATHGRAYGENLVDHYTVLLHQFLDNWRNENYNFVIDMAFIPAGEEISIFGVVKNHQIALSLFESLENEFQELLNIHHHYLDSKATSVTFGCQIFEEKSHLKKIIKFVSRSGSKSSQRYYAEYLKILLELRMELSIRVDESKFDSLLKNNPNKAVELRKYVYHKLLAYKKETRSELPKAIKLLNESNKPDKGLSVSDKKTMSRIENEIKNQ